MAYIGSGISKFNTADGLTVSGTANLDVVDIDGAVDMASTLQVDGAITSSAGATITTADNTAQLILKSTDADASVGPLFQLHRDSASPADDDAMGTIDFRGENSASEIINYVRINTRSADVTDGTEDAKFDVNTYVAGASVNRFSMTPTETVFNEDSVDVDFRVESDGNANMLFVDGGNNAVGIGAAPNTTFGSLLYTQGAPAANKPIISGYSTGNSNNAGLALFNDSGNRGIWTTGSTMRFTRTYEGNSTADLNIDASGNVGISETSPDAKLHITDSTDGGSSSITPAIQFSRRSGGSNDAVIKMQHDGSDGVSNLQFHLGASERMRITKDGDFSVSDVGFHVDGRNSNAANNASMFYAGLFLSIASYQDTALLLNRMGNNGSVISFRQAANTVGSISVTGSNTAYNTSSDYRLKTNVSYDWDATTRLKQLKPARFEWIADGDDAVPVDGFIAHEVSSIIPEAITGIKDAMTDAVLYVDSDEIPDGKKVGDVKTAPQIDPQGIDQSKLVPLLVKTIQELEARITALEAE